LGGAALEERPRGGLEGRGWGRSSKLKAQGSKGDKIKKFGAGSWEKKKGKKRKDRGQV